MELIVIGKIGYKAGRKIVKYLRDEASKNYSLLEPVTFRITGKGCGLIPYFKNDFLEIVSGIDAEGKEFCEIRIQAFPANLKLWNGPSVISDIDDGRIEASLIHDLIWQFIKEISKQSGISQGKIRTWSNRILIFVWQEYADEKNKDGKATAFKAWLAGNVCNSPWAALWRWITCLVLLAFVAGCAGCAGCIGVPDDWELVNPPSVIWEGVQ